jgi:signal transduction histidine kinase
MITVRTTRRLPVADRWLAAAFVVAGAIECVVRDHGHPAQLAGNLPGALLYAVLALRRTRPLLMISVIAVVSALASLAQVAIAPDASTDSDVAIFALLVASYSLGAYASRRELLFGAPQPALLILVVDLLQPANEPLLQGLLFAVFFVVLAPVLAGRLVCGRTALVRRLRAQASQLEANRGTQVAAALAAERLRLASDCHRRLLAGTRELATRVEALRAGSGLRPEAIAGIEQTARELLTQTRQVMVSLDRVPEVINIGTDGEPPRRAARDGARRREAQPWVVLAGAALCAGLLIELNALALRVSPLLAVLACVALAVPLALAWISPVPMVAALWVLAAGFDAFVAPLDSSIAAIGLSFVPPFVVAALCSRTVAVAGFAVCCAGELVCFGPSGMAGHVLVGACCWISGAVLRERSVLVEQLRHNAELLHEQRESAARQAIVEERARLVRELHDAFGHSLTVVTLQAGAARRMWDGDRARAEAILDTVATIARQGVADLQARFEATADATPGADATSLAALLDGARAAGLTVHAELDDVAARLDGDAGFTLYRVLQEALTNVLKHAPGSLAEVSLRNLDARVEVRVSNTSGNTSAEGAAGSGRGLVGMRERVTACGGTLSWRRDADGGFEVRAELPLASGGAAMVPA